MHSSQYSLTQHKGSCSEAYHSEGHRALRLSKPFTTLFLFLLDVKILINTDMSFRSFQHHSNLLYNCSIKAPLHRTAIFSIVLTPLAGKKGSRHSNLPCHAAFATWAASTCFLSNSSDKNLTATKALHNAIELAKDFLICSRYQFPRRRWGSLSRNLKTNRTPPALKKDSFPEKKTSKGDWRYSKAKEHRLSNSENN